jgi:hypothetical protein
MLMALSLVCLLPTSALAQTDDTIQGVFLSPDYTTTTSATSDVAAFYRYSDTYFDSPASTFDAQLADMSLCLSMATLPRLEDGPDHLCRRRLQRTSPSGRDGLHRRREP